MPSRKKSRRLARNGEWIGGLVQTPFYVEDRDPPYRAKAVFWLDLPDGGIVATNMVAPDETSGAVGKALELALVKPMTGRPRRPHRIRVANKTLAAEVRAVLGDAIPITIAPTPELDAVVEVMARSVEADGPGRRAGDSYLAGGKLKPATVGKLFRAAEALYRIAPWQVMTDNQTIRLDIPALDVQGACLTVIGNLGESLGLMIFATLTDYEAFAEAGLPFADMSTVDLPESSWLALTFERGADLPDAMRKEIATHGWSVAAPDAFPELVRYEPDLVSTPLTERDLEIATATATALSTFFVKHRALFAMETYEPACESFFNRDQREVRLCAPYESYPEFEITTAPATPGRRHAAPTPGRNDPCHCGSGRKYKRCHLREDEEARSEAAAVEEDPEARLIDELMAYANERFGRPWVEPIRSFVDVDETMQLAVPFALYDCEVEDATVVDSFLTDFGQRLPAADRAILEAQSTAWLTVWEVTAVEPGVSLTLTDLLSRETRHVRETTASQSLVVRDAILARVIELDGIHLLRGLHPRALTPDHAAEVLRRARGRLRRTTAVPVERLRNGKFGCYLIKRWEEQVAELDRRRSTPPRLSNNDGDPLLITTDHFRFAPGAGGEIAAGLESIEGVRPPGPDGEDMEYVFVRPDSTILGHVEIDGAALLLRTNSIRRADTLRAMVEAACGDLIRHQLRDHADLRSPAYPAGVGDHDRPESTPEMQQIEKEFMRRHYASWPDQSLPALGGRTPREAARTKAGRQELDVLLKSMENMESRIRGADGFDFSGLRRELGLD